MSFNLFLSSQDMVFLVLFVMYKIAKFYLLKKYTSHVHLSTVSQRRIKMNFTILNTHLALGSSSFQVILWSFENCCSEKVRPRSNQVKQTWFYFLFQALLAGKGNRLWTAGSSAGRSTQVVQGFIKLESDDRKQIISKGTLSPGCLFNSTMSIAALDTIRKDQWQVGLKSPLD